MTRARLFAAALLSIGGLKAQPTGVSGPIEGFTFDPPTNSIRAVIGSLGSSTLGPPIVTGLDLASVSPGRNYGVAVRQGQTLLVSGLGTNQVSTAVISGLLSAPQGVAWSGDGSVAVAYSQTEGWMQTVTGLPSAASASSPVSAGTIGGMLSTVAVDMHGHTVIAGLTGDDAGVYELTPPNTSFSPLLQVSQPIALAFSEDGGTVYVLDASTNEVSEIDLATLANQTWPPSAPGAVSIQPAVDAANQQVLYVAAGNLLQIYSRVTHQALTSVALAFGPTVIEPLGASSFVLRSRVTATDPLWSFADRGQPTVFFVPAMPSESEYRREVLRK